MSQNKKIFVSYVKDNAEEVKLICETFTQNSIEYWIDREDIEPGKIWKQAIRDAISNGAFFLACFSDVAVTKSETYMNEELLLGVEILRIKPYNSGWLIPIKLSPCEIPQLDIGPGKTLQDLQYLNFYKDWDIEIGRLVDMIKREESPPQSESQGKYLTYLGLKSLIESGSGTGFHNGDLGHPVYRIGASDDATDSHLKDWAYADSPDKNLLFKMLSRLSKELKKAGIEEMRDIRWYDFSEWRRFCKFVIDVYDRKMGYKEKRTR